MVFDTNVPMTHCLVSELECIRVQCLVRLAPSAGLMVACVVRSSYTMGHF